MLTCFVLSQSLLAMDVSLKRDTEKADLQKSDRPEKRQCTTQFLDISNLSISKLIVKAYEGDERSRLAVIKKLFYGDITPKSFNINIIKLLNIDVNKLPHLDQQISFIDKLHPMEIYLLCEYNPDKILSSELGKNIITRLKNNAEKDAFAQYNLGCYYLNDSVLKSNSKKASELLVRAHDQGFAPAQYKLGAFLMKNLSIYSKLGPIKAKECCTLLIMYYTKAADQGLAIAQEQLAQAYMKGIPNLLDQDLQEAIKLLNRATQQGFGPAQAALGHYYLTGNFPDILDEDPVLDPLDGLGKNSISDILDGLDINFILDILDVMYKDPILDILDVTYKEPIKSAPQKAIELLTLAVEHGNSFAQHHLAHAYMNGVPNVLNKDPIRAIELWTLSAMQGYADAKKTLKFLFNAPLTTLIEANIQEFNDKAERLQKNAEKILTEISQLQERNDPQRSINLIGTTTNGIATTPLHDHYKQYADYTAVLIDILKYLRSEKAMSQGFLVNCIELKKNEYTADILKYCSLPQAEKIHIVRNPENKILFSFGNAENIAYSKIIQELIDLDSSRNQSLDKREQNMCNLEVLNKIQKIARDLLILIYKSTDLRNELFKPKSVLWNILA